MKLLDCVRPIMNPADIGWVAGIIDGEGTICARPKSRGSRYVEVSMTTEESILQLKEITGMGHVRGPYPKDRKKPIWIWHVADSRELVRLYLAIYPMLTIEDKKQRIADSLDNMSQVIEKWGDRPCIGCAVTFSPTSPWKKYCSKYCLKETYRTEKLKPFNYFPCLFCGSVFSVKGQATKKYCSRGCGQKYRRALRAKPVHCINCRSEFKRKNNTQKYCSVSCRDCFYKRETNTLTIELL